MIPAWMLVAGAWAAEEEDFRGYVDQARFFIRKEWYGDARDQLELAVGSDDGRLSGEAWFLLARVRYELGDVPGARQAADRAHVHARSDDEAQQAAALHAWLRSSFGTLVLTPSSSRPRVRVSLRADSLILDPQLKVYLQRLQARLSEPVTLPVELGLPVGTYTVNGEQVVVEAGAQAVRSPRARGGLRALELELGGGLVTWLRRDHLLPAPTTGLALSAPLGPTVVGVMADWSLQPYQTRDGSLFAAPTGWSVGGRVGAEVPGIAPLVLRGSAGARITRLPAAELSCASEGDGYRCAPDAAVRQLVIYPDLTGWGPTVELAALVMDRGRRRAVGGGVKVSGEYLLGRLPAAGTARTARSVPYPWRTDEGAWTALGVRAVADLSYAF